MPSLNNNQQALFALLKAGLWEQEVSLFQFEKIDFTEVYRLAEEQSVLGLATAGLDHVADIIVPKEIVLQFVGNALQLEQRNKAMNTFVGSLINKTRAKDIYTLLVKGQGIAQCYERPSWRASGDVDLLLSEDNYIKAIDYLKSQASRIDEENPKHRHLALNIGPWVVELHGTLHSGLWHRLDKTLDQVQNEVFRDGQVRSWMNGNTQIFLPRADEDIVFVFAHVLQHFFQEGVGLRQICDWCRLLWTYREQIDLSLLIERLKSMGVMSEWKSFAAFAVNTLGMPEEAMPFYSSDYRWKRNAKRITDFVLETGNFGHNRDYSYYEKYPYFVYKMISLGRHTLDGLRYLPIFPIDSIKVWWCMIRTGAAKAVKGK